MEENNQNENKETVTQPTEDLGCFKGCLTLIVMLFLLIIMITACGDNSSPSYQPGDFDFDGDSGDFDDATKFLEWKMKQEE